MSDRSWEKWENKGWELMEATLNEEMPLKSPHRNKSFYLSLSTFFLFLSTLLLGFYSYRSSIHKKELIQDYEKRILNSVVLSEIQSKIYDLDKQATNFIEATSFPPSNGLNHRGTFLYDQNNFTSSQARSSNQVESMVNNELVNDDNNIQAIELSTSEMNGIRQLSSFSSFDHDISKNKSFFNDSNNQNHQNTAERESTGQIETGFFAMSGTNNQYRLQGLSGGVYIDIPVVEDLSFETGLGYLWSRNNNAIQADQIDEIIISNKITGEQTTAIVEYPTKIVIDNLHYINIPVGINYAINSRIKAGVGAEGRFLINNYYSDHIADDYNQRFNPYVNEQSPFSGTAHDYDLRNYALGATGKIELKLNDDFDVFGRYYQGLINISGDKVFNQANKITNSTFNIGLKYNLH